VIALGVTWILDGLEVTLKGAISGVLQEPATLPDQRGDRSDARPEDGTVAIWPRRRGPAQVHVNSLAFSLRDGQDQISTNPAYGQRRRNMDMIHARNG